LLASIGAKNNFIQMEKHFLIEQPPLSAKYKLLVDDMSEKRNFGVTTDIDKIN
jgi:hypothetical protein